MQVIIRNATEQDQNSILKIFNDAVVNTTAVYDESQRSQEDQLKWFQAKEAAQLPVLVAVLNNEVVGFCTFGSFRSWPGFAKTVEWSVYVSPSARGAGVATKLLVSLEEKARELGHHVIIGGVDASNDISIALHKKLGFSETGRLPQVGRKFGRWLDLVFMQKILGE